MTAYQDAVQRCFTAWNTADPEDPVKAVADR
jgi:hypothetical protein